jgi:hypothetical protein
VFTELQPQGCCRDAAGGSNTLSYLFMSTIQACQAACLNRADCGGIEFKYSNNICELHPAADTAQTNPDTNCDCFRRAPATPTVPVTTVTPVTTRPATSPTFVELMPQGCCRNAGGTSNTLPGGYIFMTSIAACQAACANRADCGAIEFKSRNNFCELHPAADAAQTNPDTNCQCFSFGVAPVTEMPTMAPTPPPTASPTVSPTNAPTVMPSSAPTSPTESPTMAPTMAFTYAEVTPRGCW